MRPFAPLSLVAALSLSTYACVGDDPASPADAGATPDTGTAADTGTTPDTGTAPDTGTPPPADAGPQDSATPPDPNDPKAVCAAVAGTIPSGTVAAPEVFGPNMIGCPGKLAYEPRVVAGACGAGWAACNATQVKARPVNPIINPKYHYWLDPRLWASPGGDTGRCYAAPAAGNPSPGNCGNNANGSMHLCSKVKLNTASPYNTPDDLGNTCGQVNCDFNPPTFTSSTTVPNNATTLGDFGGCGNGETAGVLCCKLP